MISSTLVEGYYLFYRKGTIDEFIYGEVIQHGHYDKYKDYVKNVKSVIDLGAHIGIFTLKALSNNPKCKVWSWEIEQSNFNMLQMNINNNKLNKRCKIYEFGVSKFAMNRSVLVSPTNTGANMIKDFLKVGFAGGGKLVRVATMDFESVLNITGLKQIDLVKCDVEGAELEMFEDVSRACLRRIKCYMMEAHYDPKDVNDVNKYNKLIKQFQDANFDVIVNNHIVTMIRKDK